MEIAEFLRPMQERTDVRYLEGFDPDFLSYFTLQRLFRTLACLDMPSWKGDGPRHYPFCALTLLSEYLIVLHEHKGNTLDQMHISHHRRTPYMLWHLTPGVRRRWKRSLARA